MRSTCAIVVLLIVHSSLLTAQDSCGIIWDEPILLSDTNYNAYSPKIALSGEDTVHVTWSNGSGTIRLPYIRSLDGGDSFGPRMELLPDSLNFPFRANGPKVIAWHQNVYVVFQGASRGIYSPIRMVRSSDGGNSWSYPVDISPDTSGPPPLTPTIFGDTIAMSYLPGDQVRHNILRSTDGGLTWVSIPAGLPYSHRFALGTRVGLSAGGVLHLVQIGVVGNRGETEYRRSHDLGDTWVQTMYLSTVDGIDVADPTIAASTKPGDSTVIAAWTDLKYGCLGILGCSIIARSGSAGTDSTRWQEERVLTELPRGSQPSVSITPARAAVTWADEVVPNTTFHTAVRVTPHQDTSWCPVADITPTTTYEVIAPQIALATNAVHVVWHQAVAPSPSTFRIFYRRGRFTTTSVGEHPAPVPGTVTLCQNYPNPFNASTTIKFQIRNHKSQIVSLRVYDVLGQEVATLVNEKKDAGEYTVEWNAEGLPSGVYFYRLFAGGHVETKKAILVK